MNKKHSINKTPARLDFIQSFTGIILALFISGHILFESSILISKDAMYIMTQFFEGYYFFGDKHPVIISFLATSILLIIVIHALIALRKFPSNYKQYKIIKNHIQSLNHHDTSLWAIQVITGFGMFFLASIHLYTMITLPDMIGPYASADRITSGMMWPLYLLLLFSVITHAAIGVYRLILKWGFFEAKEQKYMKERRSFLRMLMYFIITFYLIIGIFALAKYMSIGYEHNYKDGERYHFMEKTK